MNLLSKVRNIGADKCINPEEYRHVTILNQLACVSLIGHELAGLNVFFLGQPEEGIQLFIFGAVQLLVLFLNYKGWQQLSALFLMGSVNFMIFLFDSMYGRNAGTYLYYFPLCIAISMIFDLRKHKKQFVAHAIITFSCIVLQASTNYVIFHKDGVPEEFVERILGFNIIVTALLSVILLFIISMANYRLKDDLETIIQQKTNTENKLSNSVKEKEILLAEVHHRVKNNLAIIASLLNLKMSTVENEFTREVLLDCKNRVLSMSLIHDKLYKSTSISEINFKLYISELLNEISTSYPTATDKINFKIQCEELFLTLNQAIPCGLLLNELVTNSVKYAFLEKSTDNLINIELSKSDSGVCLEVNDNGAGFDYSKRKISANSLGLILIESLAEQLEGTGGYDHQFKKGTKYTLKFKMN